MLDLTYSGTLPSSTAGVRTNNPLFKPAGGGRPVNPA